jgi:hypothetical protein
MTASALQMESLVRSLADEAVRVHRVSQASCGKLSDRDGYSAVATLAGLKRAKELCSKRGWADWAEYASAAEELLEPLPIPSSVMEMHPMAALAVIRAKRAEIR